ncbi:MAG: T9SS type A sorting domain-containing protein [Bacteroidetes bacterium]|nr:T9SS type A sorting domain-containing protein [Bacteroidota bacterium]
MKSSKVILLTIIYCGLILWFSSPTSEKVHVTAADEYFDGPDEFFKFHHDIRTPADASKPGYQSGYKLRELKKAQQAAQRLNAIQARTQSNGVLEWKERGPSNVPGRTRGLVVDPDDANKNTWYAASVGGGVWKTTNAGTSWTLITPDVSNLATTVLAMAESNHNVMYIGTGEGFGNLDGVGGSGMFKSTDRGVTWSHLSTTVDFGDINRMIINPSDENMVVVASNSGIFKTIDGGDTWTKVSSLTFVQDLKATPGNFAIQYAAQNGVGVLKSIDSGDTWSLSNVGMGSVRRVEIAVAPSKPQRIFASCENGDSPKLLVSDDAGVSWSIVKTLLNGAALDFLGGTQASDGQGWYDNTVVCDPFDASVVYVGGINLFRFKLETTSTTSDIYGVDLGSAASLLDLVNFNGNNGNFELGTSANKSSVEVRFGPGKSQKAHRFLVPEGATSGVAASNYTYTDYVTVPFEVWDVTNNKQLMVSFRDQGRNGTYDLITSNTTTTEATQQSREYIYINNVAYDAAAPNASIATNGGHQFNEMYFFWPVLADGGVWPPTTNRTLSFNYLGAQQNYNSTTIFITDVRGQYGTSKNAIVHADQHNLVAIPMTGTTYKILNANDGGVFISNTSATPGINDGDWTFAGNSYNTTQFYGADKRPGYDEYLGGAQDNGTWKSPANTVASASTNYLFKIGGDGFEVLWHSTDDKKLIGGSQNNGFGRSIDGGNTWVSATSGLSGTHPFISKLANSKDNPEVIYTLSSAGVFKSTNFGGAWTLTPITNKWGGASSLMDIDVSRANANIVWAGSGMANSGNVRNIHVSTNAGTSFTPTNNYSDVALGAITKLATHPTEPNTAYVLFSFAGRPKILRTTDLGQSWTDISGFNTSSTSSTGFPDVAVYCLYVRTDDPNIIWAGTEIGIVESLDNGATWALLEDFPNVSVWDIKGQDDQIVIATHGRGIMTAKVGTAQTGPINKPVILAAGTSPQSKFMVKFHTDALDSIQVLLNSNLIGSLKNLANGDYVLKITNAPVGSVETKLIGYKNSAPYHSVSFSAQNLTLKSYAREYFNLMLDGGDFSLNKFFILDFGNSNTSLQTSHPYASNSELSATLLVPMIISSTNSNFYFRDVAVVQPSADGVKFGQPEFKDFVVVEATKDGLTWTPLKDGYSSSSNQTWLTAFNANQSGTSTLEVNQEINIKNTFAATDTLLFRFRLKSNADNTNGWGWSIDNLFIQQIPTGIEDAAIISDALVFPNPTNGKATVQYTLLAKSPVALTMMDASGKAIHSFGQRELEKGEHQYELDFSGQENGLYIIQLKTNRGDKTLKVLVRR